MPLALVRFALEVFIPPRTAATIAVKTRGKPAYNAMTLKFAVDQAEAIRRGIESSSTIRLEVDIPSLPQEVRNFIADRFSAGEVLADPSRVGYSAAALLAIPQPDVQGMLEKINSELAAG